LFGWSDPRPLPILLLLNSLSGLSAGLLISGDSILTLKQANALEDRGVSSPSRFPSILASVWSMRFRNRIRDMTQQENLRKERPCINENNDTTSRAETSLAEILIILSRRKQLVLFPGLILAIAAAVVVQFVPDSFTAEAVILPPQQQQTSFAALAAGAIGGLGGEGIASQMGARNAGDLFVGMLKSRTISDAMISRFKLREVYKTRLASGAQRALKNHTSFISGKDSLLSIAVEDHDPNRAAAMANAFIDELYKLNSRLVITDASHRRLFFHQRLRQEKEDLSDAEIALKNTQTATGLVIPSGQAEVLIRSAAQLRAEISMQEVSLQATRAYATEDNAQVQVLKKEIATMQAQLGRLEDKGEPGSSLEVSGATLPAAYLAYIRKVRDVKYHEMLYELLAKQYETALIDEAREAPVIQVIDEANVPDRKSGPKRVLLILESGLAGVVMSALYAVGSRGATNLFFGKRIAAGSDRDGEN
jgi:tyrosine-protein kinase Etk/Wzc